MPPPYRELLESLRKAFPQPVSDPVHDAYVVYSILRALDRLDDMKSEVPVLGKPGPLAYDEARQARLADAPATVERVTNALVETFEGLPIAGHPRNQINVVPPPTIASIVGVLLPSIHNPNLVSDDTSHRIAVAEERVTAITADLIGYDPSQAGGVFTFGGTGTTLYGVKIGLEKALPGAMDRGIHEPAWIFSSAQSHYARLNVGGWLGIGENHVVEIDTHLDNSMKIDGLERELRRVLDAKGRVAAIVATLGTTDAFGLDDLGAVVRLRDRLADEYGLDYRPHVHADAVIGWAWSVFRDYDIEKNPLGFRRRTLRALAGTARRVADLHLADSVGVDFHKTGFCPYVSSLFVAKDEKDLRHLVRKREDMPYLFQSGERHPGIFTLETSRSGGGILAALANLLLFGREGLRAILGHIVEMAELLREHLEGHSATTVMNSENFGAVTLFRVYPDGVDTWTVKDRERSDPEYQEELRRHNEYNRRLYHYLHERAMQGDGVLLSMTDCYRHSDFGEPIVALKSYILSPFVDEEHVRLIAEKVLEAREVVGAQE